MGFCRKTGGTGILLLKTLPIAQNSRRVFPVCFMFSKFVEAQKYYWMDKKNAQMELLKKMAIHPKAHPRKKKEMVDYNKFGDSLHVCFFSLFYLFKVEFKNVFLQFKGPLRVIL